MNCIESDTIVRCSELICCLTQSNSLGISWELQMDNSMIYSASQHAHVLWWNIVTLMDQIKTQNIQHKTLVNSSWSKRKETHNMYHLRDWVTIIHLSLSMTRHIQWLLSTLTMSAVPWWNWSFSDSCFDVFPSIIWQTDLALNVGGIKGCNIVVWGSYLTCLCISSALLRSQSRII